MRQTLKSHRFEDLTGPRQLSWPVDDNYLGRLSAAAGCAWVTGFTVIPRTTTTRNRDARQAHHGSSNDQVQAISSAVHSTGGSSQGGHQRSQRSTAGAVHAVAFTARVAALAH